MSELLIAGFLGIIEGLTEFVPVSSTGHLILFGHLLDFHGQTAATFEIFIQLGAILAVVYLYFQHFLSLFRFDTDQTGLRGFRGMQIFAVACLPIYVLGFLLHEYIKQVLFSPLTVAIALILGGLVMIVVERREQKVRVTSLDQISLRQAFVIGIAQCFALWPGMSRSGSTIVGGMLIGLDRVVAAEFSFLVAVPVMVVAVGYDTLKSLSLLSAADIPVLPLALSFRVSRQ